MKAQTVWLLFTMRQSKKTLHNVYATKALAEAVKKDIEKHLYDYTISIEQAVIIQGIE